MKKTATDQPKVLRIDDISVEVIRSRRKSLSLEVGQNGIRARAPLRMSEHAIQQFVRSKQNWLRKHLHKLPQPSAPLHLSEGCQLSLLGDTHTLRLAYGRGPIKLNHDRQIVLPLVQSHLPLTETIRNKLVAWYKQQALIHLHARVTHFAPMLGVKNVADSIKVKHYKRRWGSCDHLGKLSFNWRIIMTPESVLDYVVVHELAHLLEFNHSARFWHIVETHMPNWKTQQQWLAANGSQLYRF